MILVNCPLMQKDIIQLIESYEINDEKVFSLHEKKNIQLYFNSKIDDKEACSIIKGLIKNYKHSPALVYHVVTYSDGTINWYK